MVSFSRISGNPGKLFGSPLTDHQNFVRLRLGRAERTHRLGEDGFFGQDGDIVEANLSAAQFAELITTMNIGQGVPCTVVRLGGQPVEPCPDEPTEQQLVQAGFESDAKSLAAEMEAARGEIAAAFESKKSLGKHDREKILKRLDRMIRSVKEDMPFMLDQFRQAAQRMANAAKTEIDAFVSACAMAEGMRSLADKAQKAPPRLQAHCPEEPRGTLGDGDS